jgi:hypothetical protein
MKSDSFGFVDHAHTAAGPFENSVVTNGIPKHFAILWLAKYDVKKEIAPLF